MVEALREPAEYAPARVFAVVPAPMLARLESSLLRGADWRYEPKLDGFRGLLWRSGSGQVRLLSRNLKDLSLSFPELVRAGDSLPLDTVIDGEIVIADEDGHADFGALQNRLGAGRRAAGQVAHSTAVPGTTSPPRRWRSTMPELLAWPFPLPECFTERLGYERTVEAFESPALRAHLRASQGGTCRMTGALAATSSPAMQTRQAVR